MTICYPCPLMSPPHVTPKLSRAEAPSGYRFHINYVVTTHSFQPPHRLSTELQPHISICLLGVSPWVTKTRHTLPGPKQNSWFPAPALQNTLLPPSCPSQKNHLTTTQMLKPESQESPLTYPNHTPWPPTIARISRLNACKDWAPRFHSRPPQSTLPAARGESFLKGQLGHATHLFKKPQSFPITLIIHFEFLDRAGPYKEGPEKPGPACLSTTSCLPATPPSSVPGTSRAAFCPRTFARAIAFS